MDPRYANRYGICQHCSGHKADGKCPFCAKFDEVIGG